MCPPPYELIDPVSVPELSPTSQAVGMCGTVLRRWGLSKPIFAECPFVLQLPDREQLATALIEILTKIDVFNAGKRPREVLEVAGFVEQRNDAPAIAAVLERIDELMLNPLGR